MIATVARLTVDHAAYYGGGSNVLQEPEPKKEQDRVRPMARFEGEGAATLGLQGERIEKDDPRLNNLFAGKSPDGNVQLRAMYDRTRKDHLDGQVKTLKARPFYDITANAPKDISILYATGSDEDRAKLIGCHQRATDSVIQYLTNRSTTRINSDASQVEKVKPLFAVIDHDTNRKNEPHLHSHLLLMNSAQRTNGKWGALDVSPLFSSQHKLGGLYIDRFQHEFTQTFDNKVQRVELAKGHSFKIDGISEEVRAGFSTRTADIEDRKEQLKAQGMTLNSKVVQIAMLDTRDVSDRGRDKKAVEANWGQRAKELGFNGQGFLRTSDRGKEKTRGIEEQSQAAAERKWSQLKKDSDELPSSTKIKDSTLKENFYKDIDRQTRAVRESYQRKSVAQPRESFISYSAPKRSRSLSDYAGRSKLLEPVFIKISTNNQEAQSANLQQSQKQVAKLTRPHFEPRQIRTGQTVTFGSEVKPSKIIKPQSKARKKLNKQVVRNLPTAVKKILEDEKWQARKVEQGKDKKPSAIDVFEKARGRNVARRAKKKVRTGQTPQTAPGALTLGEKTIRKAPGGDYVADKALRVKYGQQQVRYKKVSATTEQVGKKNRTVEVKLENSTVRRQVPQQVVKQNSRVKYGQQQVRYQKVSVNTGQVAKQNRTVEVKSKNSTVKPQVSQQGVKQNRKTYSRGR